MISNFVEDLIDHYQIKSKSDISEKANEMANDDNDIKRKRQRTASSMVIYYATGTQMKLK